MPFFFLSSSTPNLPPASPAAGVRPWYWPAALRIRFSLNFSLLAFALGVIGASYLPGLPAVYLCGLWLAVLWLLPARSWCVYGWCFGLGLAWGITMGHQLLAGQLDERLEEDRHWVQGWIEDIPHQDDDKIRFVLRLDTKATRDSAKIPERLQLSWYQRGQLTPRQLIPGQYWQFHVKLKRPRGLVNPGGFDYHAWLLRRGFGATGYIAQAQQLAAPGAMPLQSRIDSWRWSLQQWVLNNSQSNSRAILVALLIGDSSGMAKSQWQLVQQTGISHLIAISGLHVGFLALVGYCLGLGLGRCLQGLGATTPAQRWAYVCAIVFATGYSALAGFNIPTVRTLIMLSVFYLAALFYRPARLSHIYHWALALVLMIDPLAAFDRGFWLSFGAVALLILAFSGRYKTAQDKIPLRWRHRLLSQLIIYGRSQWVMFIGLLVPLAWLINSTPLLSPIANFIAIPLITFFVVPCLLLGAALAFLHPGLGNILLSLAAGACDYLIQGLEVLLQQAPAWHNPVLAFSLPAALLLLMATIILLLPQGLLPRWLGYMALSLGLASSAWPQPTATALQLSVLDVGQGTALVVSTANHHLVFDTGPEYSKDFDGGTGIVLPYLHAQGIRQLDALVISHWDMDHAGGYAGLMAAMSPRHFYWGEPLRTGQNTITQSLNAAAISAPGKNCHQESPWVWDQVEFQFLTRPLNLRDSPNNQSCVLLIRYRDQTILLPGDLESSGEWALLRGDQLPAKLTLLMAAHHGSNSSSNPGFVAYTQPQWVIYSAGYKNQHNHPHPKVQQRFNVRGSHALNTADSGALVFRWNTKGEMEWFAARDRYQRYWH